MLFFIYHKNLVLFELGGHNDKTNNSKGNNWGQEKAPSLQVKLFFLFMRVCSKDTAL